ncbi:helix-turn-helix transcriptional regulator [Streptomyces sp. NBC_01218]|uniref:helix-turn-helix domain-containing protein n=1 Tax=unclassified Streptomyces TaxID=2593676 RepID=UPI002E11284D|nr:helix-turn-helix transcriptional regulator [Streptomyces sp. NBC_01218]
MSNTYGEWLRARREAAGHTQQQLADLAFMTRSHISHIEAGRRVPSLEDARRLDQVLNTGDVLSSFRPIKDSVVATRFAPARELEQQASMISEFALSYVPGILQTQRYANAVMLQRFPPWTDEERDSAVVTRLERGKILDNPSTPVVMVVLDEVVLRRPIGGGAVMAEQIGHLIRLTEAGRIHVHVLPLSLGAHPLLQGMVTLMDFVDLPPAAYVEAMNIATLHDSPAVVERLQKTYALALGEALPSKETLALLREARKGHEENG